MMDKQQSQSHTNSTGNNNKALTSISNSVKKGSLNQQSANSEYGAVADKRMSQDHRGVKRVVSQRLSSSKSPTDHQRKIS